MSAPNPLTEFLDRYYSDPVLFVREVLAAEPDEKQQEVLRAIAAGERRISVRSGHGVGKTTVLAWAIVWRIATRYPQKTVCTAPTSSQLFDALAAETKSWFNRLPLALQDLFDVMTEKIVLRADPEASFVSFRTSRPELPEALAGVHSDHVFLVCDEASGIPEQVFEAAIGSMSGVNAVTVLAGNPVRTSGLFYDSHHKLRDMWHTIHISCVGHPRVSADFIEDVIRRYGRDSNQYLIRVEGNFPREDDDTVISRELAESALYRDVQATYVMPVWGVDCARGGADASALAKRKGNVLLGCVEEKRSRDLMVIAGWVKHEWDSTLPSERPSAICVDVIGIGAGVSDRLAELGLPANGINVSETVSLLDHHYSRVRDELWFKGHDWLLRKDCSLNGDVRLVEELVGPRFAYASNGKIKVESKEEMRKRKLWSPNRADAFLLTLASETVTLIHGSEAGRRASWKEPLRRNLRGIV